MPIFRLNLIGTYLIAVVCFSVLEVNAKKKRLITEKVNDPGYKNQWYLGPLSNDYPGRHNNIISAWMQGATGRGVLVAILDNGIQLDHPDLKDNIDVESSFNYLNASSPPIPTTRFDKYRHGTQMAGIIGMSANNKKCGIGIAFHSKIASIKILGPVMNVSQHAKAHMHKPQKVDIYSESYGPYDNGKVTSRYQPLTIRAIRHGIEKGRKGRGNIYVKSSGNGRPNNDHCGADGTVNIIFNIAVASAARDHKVPIHSEECASILTSVYTQHTSIYRPNSKWKDVITLGVNSTCVTTNGGSSTATAIASGIIALALSVNKKLTWRDVQHLVVVSSSKNGLTGDWVRNGAGKQVSHSYGYGVLNAGKMVKNAKNWNYVPKMEQCYTPFLIRSKVIKVDTPPHREVIEYNIPGCTTVDIVEQVSVVTSTKFSKRGDIEIRLTSPSGTESLLLGQRSNDVSKRAYWRWKFTSVHYWGERVNGNWNLTISFLGKGEGYIKNTYMIFYGTKRFYSRRMKQNNRNNRWLNMKRRRPSG